MAYITKSRAATADSYDLMKEEFVAAVRGKFSELKTEIAERNENIRNRDGYIYGDLLERSLDIPIGHDFTPANWLRRTVEIHKNMFMSRGFQVISTYDSQDPNGVDEEDQRRVEVDNTKQKEYAEARMKLIQSINTDNGGASLWSTLAENASAVGDVALKAYYDEKTKTYVLSQIESMENLYVLWNKDDFRKFDAVAYVYQVSKQSAIRDFGADEDVTTSPLGSPLETMADKSQTGSQSGQPMVTIMEVTGKIEGWASENGRCKKVDIGKETELNAMIVGNSITRLIDDKKRIPKHYLLPNKRQRRRPWGQSDVSDAAIQLNLTYIETLSDWRTAASKINFNKYKAFGFSPGVQLPAPEPRQVEYIPLGEGQDIQELAQTRTDSIDWGRQLDEVKEQFVRETGISRVLFDDPSVTLNSNQALLTSMKPTSDIAEAKKQLWAPIISDIFTDALETIAEYEPGIKDLVAEEDNWTLKVMWPSVMQKEDPVYQAMLLNRLNAGTMSIQSYLEAQGESKEEIDRLRDEMNDPITAAILGKSTQTYAQAIINFATAEIQAAYQATLPQPEQPSQGQTPGVSANGGVASLSPDNQATGGVGMQPVSQPGTGATAASPAGALAQTNQNLGA